MRSLKTETILQLMETLRLGPLDVIEKRSRIVNRKNFGDRDCNDNTCVGLTLIKHFQIRSYHPLLRISFRKKLFCFYRRIDNRDHHHSPPSTRTVITVFGSDDQP